MDLSDRLTSFSETAAAIAQLDRSDTVWYTTARLFRQPKLGDWDSVYQSVARAIAQTLVPEDLG